MDRRQQKTRKAIFDALNILLQKKYFEHITVQEIIDEANIGRSTFYAHFETKEDLLRAICTDIFHHIHTNKLPEETSENTPDLLTLLEIKLSHFLFHLMNSDSNIKGILKSESETIFLRVMKEYLKELFLNFTSIFSPEIPQDFLLNYLCDSFVGTIKWWFLENDTYTPEEIAFFYVTTLKRS